MSEANEKFETKLDKEGNNFLHEGNLKKAKHSLASLEKVQEQLKAVKRKVYRLMLGRIAVLGEEGAGIMYHRDIHNNYVCA